MLKYRRRPDLQGLTEPVTIAIEQVDHEADLCGGYRRGFAGTTSFALKDYRIDYNRRLASLVTIK